MEKEHRTLSLVGNAELGCKILDAAVSRSQQKAQEQVVDYAADLMQNIENERRYLQALEADLKAIEEGEFSLAKEGRIVFNDSKRGQAHAYGRTVAACPRCGSKL